MKPPIPYSRRLVHTADDLRDLAEQSSTPVDMLERDFLLVSVAAQLAADFPGQLCFKGGFVLRHVLRQSRLSKDIDATRTAPPRHRLAAPDVAASIQQSARDLYRIKVGEAATDSGTSLDFDRIHFEGPCGTRGDIAVEVSYREAVQLDPINGTIGAPFYEPFTIPVLQSSEIVAEKLRTLVQRFRPTDLSDLAHLLKVAALDIDHDQVRDLVPVKFQLVKEGNHRARIRANIERMKPEYERAVRSVAPDAPDFDIAARAVLGNLNHWFD
jgi:predicted nucleotidyltransferase component of viral defense system